MVPSRRFFPYAGAVALAAVTGGPRAYAGGGIDDRVKQLVVHIEVDATDQGKASGFGLVVGADANRLYVVTPLHLLRPRPEGESNDQRQPVTRNRFELQLCQNMGARVPATLVTDRANQPVVNVGQDLALLSVAKPPGFTWQPRVLDQHGFEFDPGSEPEVRLVRLGKKGGCEIPPSGGKLSSRDEQGFTTEGLAAMEGYSGTPIFTTRGVLGIVVGVGPVAEQHEIEGVAIDTIRKWMQPSNLPFDLLPFSPKRLSLAGGLSYSRSGLGLDLPRDLKYHANHPDDWFLSGDPGSTELGRAWVDAVEAEGGIRYRLGAAGLGATLSYAMRIPVATTGRSERQQANDPRPPNLGTFIYSTVRDVGVSHALRAGLDWSRPTRSASRGWVEFEVLLELDRWTATVEKGWSRYGRDQAELTSKATGYALGPTARLRIGRGAFGFQLAASLPHLLLSFAQPQLQSSSASGFGFSAGFSLTGRTPEPWGE